MSQTTKVAQSQQANSTDETLISLVMGALLIAVQLLGVVVVGYSGYHAVSDLLGNQWHALAYVLTYEGGLLAVILVKVLGEQYEALNLGCLAWVVAGGFSAISAGLAYMELYQALAGMEAGRYVFNQELTALLLGPLFVLFNLLIAVMIGRTSRVVLAAWSRWQAEQATKQAEEQQAEREYKVRLASIKAESEAEQARAWAQATAQRQQASTEPAQSATSASTKPAEPASDDVSCRNAAHGCDYSGTQSGENAHQRFCKYKPEELVTANGNGYKNGAGA